MKLIDTKYVFVNVKDCEYRTFGDFNIPLPNFKSGRGLISHMYIKKSIIPYDWKAFTSANNQITITDGISPITITLTEGNPNIYDLITEINNLQTKVVATFSRTASKISFKNKTLQTLTITTTSNKLGITSPLTILPVATTTCQAIIDLAPDRILIIKSELPTSGEEVYISSDGAGQTKDTGVLSAISMDVPPYSHKIWRDFGGFYYSYITPTTKSIRFWFENTDGVPITPQTPPFLVMAIETYQDDSGELLSTQQEALRLQKFAMLMKTQKRKKKSQ